jgi:hypothetical protein
MVLALTLAAPASAAPDRQVLLVVVPELSFERALVEARITGLAGAGGIGLMTTAGRAEDPARTAVNLGAGRSADDAPTGAVPFETAGSGVRVDVAPYVEDAGAATPGLLGSTLSEAGATVAYVGTAPEPGEVALLTAMDREGLIPVAVLGVNSGRNHDPLARALDTAELVVMPDLAKLRIVLARTEATEVLVIVTGAGASPRMHDLGDTVSAIVVAQGDPDELLGADLPRTGLTSDTTRREGVVADIDVAPTILDFLDVPAPQGMVGSPIRIEGSAPTDLHERYLDFRALVGPIGAAILGLALVSLALGLVAVFALGGRPAWLARTAGIAMLVALSLFVATTTTSMLPTFTTGPVIGCLLLVGAGVFAVAWIRGRSDPRAGVATIAVAGLAFVMLDGALGWPSQLTPLLGGGVLDGERFFGLGNAHAGILLVGAVLGAARLPGRAGVWLIVPAAVVAGLPFLGADLGGAVTLAVAAGLWFGIARWRLGWRTWALAASAAIGAGVLVIVADRLLPGGATHVSSVGGGVLEAFVDRLAANVQATSANASAWLAVLGLPVWFAVALRRPARLEPTLAPDERWRDALLVLPIAGIVGYLVNDTYGLAGSVFAFVSAAMLVPTLRVSGGEAATVERTGLESVSEGPGR